ncbi:MAG TPA: efflux RND transporter periplasmic adaptor subunit [Candidatus Aquicultor sp.]|jgi:HlyD family secretion protein
MHKERLAIPIVLLLLLGLAYGWYSYAGASSSSNGNITGSGTIEAVDLNVGSQIASAITDIKVTEGQKVSKGDMLIKLDDNLLRDQVTVAKAGVDAAQAGVDDASGANQIKIAKAQRDQAKANLAMAQIQLGYAGIKAPADGVILSLPYTEGEVVSPGATLVTLGKTSQLELTIYVDETNLGRVKNGQKTDVTVDAYPNRTFEGKVTEISSQAEFTPQNVQTKEQRSNLVFGVKIRIQNSDDKLKPGMPADAVLQ